MSFLTCLNFFLHLPSYLCELPYRPQFPFPYFLPSGSLTLPAAALPNPIILNPPNPELLLVPNAEIEFDRGSYFVQCLVCLNKNWHGSVLNAGVWSSKWVLVVESQENSAGSVSWGINELKGTAAWQVSQKVAMLKLGVLGFFSDLELNELSRKEGGSEVSEDDGKGCWDTIYLYFQEAPVSQILSSIHEPGLYSWAAP